MLVRSVRYAMGSSSGMNRSLPYDRFYPSSRDPLGPQIWERREECRQGPMKRIFRKAVSPTKLATQEVGHSDANGLKNARLTGTGITTGIWPVYSCPLNGCHSVKLVSRHNASASLKPGGETHPIPCPFS